MEVWRPGTRFFMYEFLRGEVLGALDYAMARIVSFRTCVTLITLAFPDSFQVATELSMPGKHLGLDEVYVRKFVRIRADVGKEVICDSSLVARFPSGLPCILCFDL